MKVIVNGIEIDNATDLTTLKNGQLNTILGENGEPKYSVNQLKGKTKAQLADEAREVVNAATPKASKKARKSEPAGPRQPTVSKTRDVAASKKCNLLKALANGKTVEAHIYNVLKVDTVLAEYWKTVDQDIANVLSGAGRPKATGRAGAIVVTIED